MRIVSLHPAATELLFSLGAGTYLVARTDSCDYPEGATRVPSIGPLNSIGKDSIAIMEPDLVLAGPGQETSDMALLCEVFKVAPRTLNEVYDVIKELGAKLEKQVEADMIIHDLKLAFERIAEKTVRFHKANVLCEQHGKRAELYVLELLTLAGGQPYLGEHKLEQIKSFDPRFIIAIGDPDDLTTPKDIERREGWDSLGAVQHEMVFMVDESLLRPTSRLVQGAKKMAKVLHGVDINGSF